MPRESKLYQCKYCDKIFASYEEALECEKSHEKNYDNASRDEIAEELRMIGDLAPGYHVGETVFGIPLDSFCSIIDRAIELIREDAD